jgi:hypothetical protein
MIFNRASLVSRRWIVVTALATLLTFGIQDVSADAPAVLRIEVHFNFLTQQPNSWTASGAFVDHGMIGLDENNETFLGQARSPVLIPVQVRGPIVADDGSKIYWQFNKQNFVATPTQWIARGRWHILFGTGRYAGIKGEGDLEGTLNLETGEIVDIFTGLVYLPSQ